MPNGRNGASPKTLPAGASTPGSTRATTHYAARLAKPPPAPPYAPAQPGGRRKRKLGRRGRTPRPARWPSPGEPICAGTGTQLIPQGRQLAARQDHQIRIPGVAGRRGIATGLGWALATLLVAGYTGLVRQYRRLPGAGASANHNEHRVASPDYRVNLLRGRPSLPAKVPLAGAVGPLNPQALGLYLTYTPLITKRPR